ncbi:hypothetical protein DICVIV_07414 [Dictyocaulus viviparus]|uniref:Sugar phosphate phosphatase n=1 Tax=Dictyocaulus viviparus TaxID=29172 RepID=A0A0D8XPN9_DICVI|nr:hypothetical protein DICVIV_07414 [Dictyocaulus viviparus]
MIATFHSLGSDSLPPKLNGIEEGTFVFFTISERWPKTIAKIVDYFHCSRRILMEQYGTEADADIKAVIAELSELRYRIATDKPLEDISDLSYSHDMWNKLLANLRVKHSESGVTWFKMDWLFTECYMYRRIVGATAKTKYLKTLDYFREQKIKGFNDHLEQIRDGINFMFTALENIAACRKSETLEVLLKMCLWGNRCDLSLSCGGPTKLAQSPIQSARMLDSYILCNDFGAAMDSFILNLRTNIKGCRQFDIVLDNAGPELVGDLILAEYLMGSKHVDKTVLHGKEYPYFVSDVIRSDFEWTLKELSKLGDTFQKFSEKLYGRLKQGQLVFQEHRFWTYPQPYCEMKSVAPDLYEQLSEASFIVFKGDLNYRKLVADRKWSFETPFKTALCGFLPAPIFALRTLKSETVAGLPEDVSRRMRSQPDLKWMVTGEYGIAELAS